MKQRKRIPWGQVIGTGLSLAMGVGCGVVLTSWFDRCPAGVSRPLWALGLAAAFLLALLAQITLHEGGHLVCGLLSGYRFCSFRVGSLMWMKVDGHLRLRRLRLAGTDGQCLMSPPDMVDGRLPVTLYNFGGALANLLTAALALALYGPARRVPLLAAFLLFLAVIGGFTAAMNGIPLRLGNIDNDGRNALSLGRDPAALRAFWVQMKVAEAQARGLRLREMPEDWFSMPGDEALQNAMTAAQGVLVGEQHSVFDTAVDGVDHDLCLLTVVLGRHLSFSLSGPGYLPANPGEDWWAQQEEYSTQPPSIARAETGTGVTVELLGEARPAVLADFLTQGQVKFMGQMKRFPSVLRTRYLHALLAERDPAKAAAIRARFETVAGTYPYPADIASERELMALGDARAA